MNVDELYFLGRYIVGKNTQQGYYSSDEFNSTINQGQKNYAAFLLGIPQTYTPGRPVAKVELGGNSVVRQRLTPIIYGYNLHLDINGFSPYPGDYLQTDAMWGIYGYKRIRYADQHNFASIYNSAIDPIATNPAYLIHNVGFTFYPTTPFGNNQTRLNYVKEPPDIIWGYDEDINGLPVYNPAKSTQPVWDDLALFEILCRALVLVGISLQVSQVIAYSQEVKNQGP